MAVQKTPALGKGLEALLGDIKKNTTKPETKTQSVDAEIAYIALSDIDANPDQPRKDFNAQSLEELSQSIKENGIITPITVHKKDNRYVIIAGERRFRAAKMAGLDKIPAYIRIVSGQQVLQMALIENIQREDLNTLEIALSLKALLDSTGLTQEKLGQKIGKSRTAIANYVRLLNLPAEIQMYLRNDDLSMGHARCLINLENEKQQIDLARKIINDGLSVRQTEALTHQVKESLNNNKPKTAKKELPALHSEVLTSLSSRLDTVIQIKRSQRGKGTITIPFKNDKDFERIISLLDNK